MKLRMKSALIVAAVVAFGTANANKPALKPTLNSIARAWVAAGDWGEQYRLVLQLDGKGVLGVISPNGKPFLYSVDSVEIHDHRVEMVVRAREGGFGPAIVEGDGTWDELSLKAKPVLGSHRRVFRPEEMMRQASERLTAATNEIAN